MGEEQGHRDGLLLSRAQQAASEKLRSHSPSLHSLCRIELNNLKNDNFQRCVLKEAFLNLDMMGREGMMSTHAFELIQEINCTFVRKML